MRLSLGKTVVFLSTILSLALLTGCSLGTAEMEKTDIDVLSERSSKSWEQAETTPLGKYPELVTYTLGQMKGANNSNLPDGQTYEDNAYTRYLKKTLNIQNKNVFTYIVTKHIREVLYSPGDEKTREDLSAIEASYFDACKEYLEAEVPSVEAWAAYKSRISAVGLLVDANYRAPEKKYLGDGDGEIPQTLRLLEKNAFIQIIMGRMPVSSFDSFVEDWYRKGGDSLTERVREGLVDS